MRRSDQSALISPHVFQKKKKGAKIKTRKSKKQNTRLFLKTKRKSTLRHNHLFFWGLFCLDLVLLKRQKKVKTQYQTTDITFSLRVGCKCENVLGLFDCSAAPLGTSTLGENFDEGKSPRVTVTLCNFETIFKKLQINVLHFSS